MHKLLVCAVLKGVGADDLSTRLRRDDSTSIRQQFSTLYGKLLDLIEDGLGVDNDPHKNRNQKAALRALEIDGRYWKPDAVERLLSLAAEEGGERLRIVRIENESAPIYKTRGIIEPMVDGDHLRSQEPFRIEVRTKDFDFVYVLHIDDMQVVTLLTPSKYVGGPNFRGETIVTVPDESYDPFRATGVGSHDRIVAILFKREDPLGLVPGTTIGPRNIRPLVNAVVDFESRNRGACTVVHRAYKVVHA